MLGTVFDHAIVPVAIVGVLAGALALQDAGVPGFFVTPLVIGPFTLLAFLLERARPERAEHRALDQPLWIEAAHFVFSFELGYGLALLACAALERGVRAAWPPLWPTGWPIVLQLVLATLLYEATSYWQHRLLHRVPWLWRFHALHHSGARLNLVRAVRFHAVDIATAAFVAYLPLVLLGTPDGVVTLLAVFVSVLGILQHGNIRVRTPRWLDLVLCTPAVHRHHHASDARDSDHNFGNTFMVFDLLFGSYARGRPEGPAAVGIDDDPVPRGFWPQVLAPFRRELPARARLR